MPASVYVKRLYLDGSLGVGKTSIGSIIKDLVYSDNLTYGPISFKFVQEPMAYWRALDGNNDVISLMYDALNEKGTSPETRRNVSQTVVYCQFWFSAPYRAMYNMVNSMIEKKTFSCQTKIIVFDRHPLATALCFPITNYVYGTIAYRDLVHLLANVEAVAGTLVILDASPKTILSRILKRGRAGEQVNIKYVQLLISVYRLLYNSIKYANRFDYKVLIHSLRADKRSPETRLREFKETVESDISLNDDAEIKDTLFPILGATENVILGSMLCHMFKALSNVKVVCISTESKTIEEAAAAVANVCLAAEVNGSISKWSVLDDLLDVHTSQQSSSVMRISS